jgi:hypothetical protein
MTAEATKTSLHSAFCEMLRSRGPTLNLLFEQARMALERNEDTVVRDAFAGAIITVLHDMLRAYWSAQDASKKSWKHIAPKIGGFSIPQILEAALDNVRHYEDWQTDRNTSIAHVRSVRVLSNVLDVPLKKNAKRAALRGNVAWPVLVALSTGGSYAQIQSLIQQVAENLEKSRRS